MDSKGKYEKNKINYFQILTVILSTGAAIIAILSLISNRLEQSILTTVLLVINMLGFLGIVFIFYLVFKFRNYRYYKNEIEESHNIYKEISYLYEKIIKLYEEMQINNKRTNLITKDFEILKQISSAIAEARELIITQYTQLVNDEKVKDEKIREKLLNTPEMLNCISQLRINLYSIKQLKNIIDSEDNDNRLNLVIDSLRDFSNANISEFIDNLDYLTALINKIEFYGEKA